MLAQTRLNVALYLHTLPVLLKKKKNMISKGFGFVAFFASVETSTDGTGFNTCKGCHKTESLLNHTTTEQKEGEQLEDRRNVGDSSCKFADGTDQRVQSLMFMMMMVMMINKPSPPSLRD